MDAAVPAESKRHDDRGSDGGAGEGDRAQLPVPGHRTRCGGSRSRRIRSFPDPDDRRGLPPVRDEDRGLAASPGGRCGLRKDHDRGSGSRGIIVVRKWRHRGVGRAAGGGRAGRVKSLASALQLGNARGVARRTSALLQAFPQRRGVAADLVQPLRPAHRGECRGADSGDPADDRPERLQHVLGVNAGVAADRHHGLGPHQDDLGGWGDLVRHLDGRGADPVVEDDDVGTVHGKDARELRGGRGGADHLEAFAFQDEAQESFALGLSLANDDSDPLGHIPLLSSLTAAPPSPGRA
jgi:hypothetical protein